METKDAVEQVKSLLVPAAGMTGVGWIALLLRRWLKNVMNTKESAEIVAQKMNEAATTSIELLKTENKRLTEKILQIQLEFEQELKEKRQQIKALEAQYDMIAAQFREYKRNLGFNEAELIDQNTKLRQKVMELETELATVRIELNALKKRLEKE